MPVYLVHGFRWPREGFTGIRVHAIVHNLEDTSVEYIQNENSRSEILASFRKAYPEIMKELEGPGRKQLEFIEQYNPDDLDGPTAVSQPYAFVGDKVVMIAASPGLGLGLNGRTQQHAEADERQAQPQAQAQVSAAAATTSPTMTSPSKKTRATTQPMSKSAPFNSPADVAALSVNVEEVIADGPGLTNKAWEALADLRDKIAEGEKIGWWVVYNGDPERSYDDVDEDEEEEEGQEDEYDDEYYEQEEQQQVPFQQQQQQQQRPVTSGGSSVGRPRTAPTSDSGRAESQSHPPLPLPISATSPLIPQQQPGLTALPIRPIMAEQQREAVAPTGKPGKGKQKDGSAEPTKLKETAKSQGLRKKFFGRRG